MNPNNNLSHLNELSLQLIRLENRIKNENLSVEEMKKVKSELLELKEKFSQPDSEAKKPVVTNNAKLQLFGINFN